MAKTLARKKTLRRRSGVTAKKKTMKKSSAVKRAVRKAVGKKKMIKKVAKKVTKKLVKKISAGKKAAVPGMLGKVVHYYDRIGVAIVELTAPLMAGELVTFRRGDREFTQPVGSMQINHVGVEKAKKGDVVGIKVVQVADPGTLAIRE